MTLADRLYARLDRPMTIAQIAALMEISRQHASNTMRQLRARERVRVTGQQDGCPLWARMRLRTREEAPSGTYEAERWLSTYLDLWQRAMRAFCGPQGYPQSASGFPGRARITTFEDLEEECDQRMVAMLDARIDELSPLHRTAIYYSVGLTHRWPYNGLHPQDVIDSARSELLERMRAWTAVP
jgi:hypothetical protein